MASAIMDQLQTSAPEFRRLQRLHGSVESSGRLPTRQSGPGKSDQSKTHALASWITSGFARHICVNVKRQERKIRQLRAATCLTFFAFDIWERSLKKEHRYSIRLPVFRSQAKRSLPGKERYKRESFAPIARCRNHRVARRACPVLALEHRNRRAPDRKPECQGRVSAAPA